MTEELIIENQLNDLEIPDRSPAPVQSGHRFQDIVEDVLTTSYYNYDPAWHIQNGNWFRDQSAISLPATIAEMDNSVATFDRLVNDNAYGNKARFTNLRGDYMKRGFYYGHPPGNTYVAGETFFYKDGTPYPTASFIVDEQEWDDAGYGGVDNYEATIVIDHLYGIMTRHAKDDGVNLNYADRYGKAYTETKRGFSGWLPSTLAIAQSQLGNQSGVWYYAAHWWGAYNLSTFWGNGQIYPSNTTQTRSYDRDYDIRTTAADGNNWRFMVWRYFTNDELPNT